MEKGNPNSKTKAPGKSFLSDLEKGKRSISTPTVGKLIHALDLPQTWMDRFLGSDVAPEDEETKLDRDADRLMAMVARHAPETQTAEGLLIALAQDFAGKPFLDHWAAYASLKSALEIAASMKAQSLLPSNTGDQLSIILRRVSDLNDQGLREEAGEALEDAIKRNDAEAEALFDAALKQDRIRNRPADAAARLITNLKRSAPPGGVFKATHHLIREWREKGETLGLPFDLHVALRLAEHNYTRAKGGQQAAALSDLGTCQLRLGGRSADDKYLRSAVQNLKKCLKLATRSDDPKNWAGVQNNLGNALQALGEREGSTALLEQAVTAYQKALTVGSRAHNSQDWATRQNNLGNALLSIGKRELSIAHTEHAVIALTEALKERSQARIPLGWATTQNNLGFAICWLGTLKRDSAAFDRAAAAYALALQERRHETTPYLWALTQLNLADLALARYDLKADQALLASARGYALAASEVFAEGSEHDAAQCDALLAEIAKHEA